LGAAFLYSTAFGEEFLMRILRMTIAMVFAIAGTNSLAQTPTVNPNAKISVTSFQALAQSCAANVPVSTLEAIAHTESALYPYALNINRPHQLARRQGWSRGTITLERQPASREEALLWTKWLLAHGVTVSMGLLQVNSEHAKALHLTVEQLLEPCTNLWAGATLLARTYSATAHAQGEGFAALDTALSYYNTGSPHLGFQNGYVGQVRLNASPP
jgi:type IV secretion system protein VirB1